MSESIWVVTAEVDDYYSVPAAVAAFPTKAEAEIYATAQPRKVRSTYTTATGVAHYDSDFEYDVLEVPLSPTKPWAEAKP